MHLLASQAGKVSTAPLVTVARKAPQTHLSPFGGFLRYNGHMSLPIPLIAVYYGTIRLKDGSSATYTAEQVATFYNVQDDDYLPIALNSVYPFKNGQEEMSYIHLKPLPDGNYYDAKERHNTDFETYYDEDFDSRRNGKWAVRPQFVADENHG